MPERHWWNARFEAGFTTTTGHMRMPVDETGQQPGSAEVIFRRSGSQQHVLLVAEAKDPATTDQDVTNSEVFRREDSGVGE